MKETDETERPAEARRESLVEKAALEAGFSLVGVSRVPTDPRSRSLFEQWIARGMHGEMGYLADAAPARADPAALLPGARSVVCVALDYYSERADKRNRLARSEGRGEIALYAHGEDYHDVVRRMLADLERRLADLFPGAKFRAFVDAGPVPERTWALQAGIGWLAKNTCVVSPRFGSWLVLGELLTDLELEPGSPLETLCGTCTKCIEACPTQALGEFVLDARKCLSYLTIEKRGEIPGEWHAAIGNRLFGCDACQEVCPFNAAPRESAVFGSGASNALVEKTVDEILELSDDALRRLARGTAMSRSGPERLRRNARIVAKNRT